jgi:hypothetical protein
MGMLTLAFPCWATFNLQTAQNQALCSQLVVEGKKTVVKSSDILVRVQDRACLCLA